MPSCKKKSEERSQNQSSRSKTCWNFSKDLELRCQFQTLQCHRGYARHHPRFEFQKTSDSKFVEDTSEKRTEIYQSRVCHIERNGPRSSKRFSRQIRARRWSASSPNDKLEGCLSIREEARFVTHYRPAISILIAIARSFLFEIVLWIIVTIAQQWPNTKDGVSACLIVINARIPSDRKSNTHRR